MTEQSSPFKDLACTNFSAYARRLVSTNHTILEKQSKDEPGHRVLSFQLYLVFAI